jgi:histidine ammonia-lyase
MKARAQDAGNAAAAAALARGALSEHAPESRQPVVLNGEDLTIEQVRRVARLDAPVEIAPAALATVRRARLVVEAALASGAAVYGLTTGVGAHRPHRIDPRALRRFNQQIVLGHSTNFGELLSREAVRAMILIRANGMLKGGAGVRVELIHALVGVLNARIDPLVRSLGSVGESDLGAMAGVGRALMGHGEVMYQGRRVGAAEALGLAGLAPYLVRAKEGLALISANALAMGEGALALADCDALLGLIDVAAALSLEGFAANLSVIHPEVARMRPHPGQSACARRLRTLLRGSYLWDPGSARELQDPLSFRCIPQTHGACHDALDFAERALEVDLNSAGDNPLVVVDEGVIVSNGNFDIVSLALGFDLMRVALADLLRMANERVQKLLSRHFSGLPTGLTSHEGWNLDLNMLGRAAAVLSAESRFMANPVSLDYSAPLQEGIEDHASMAPLSVRKTSELMKLAHRMVAVELAVAAQAIDLRGHPRLGDGTAAAYALVRRHIPSLPEVKEWVPDLEALVVDVHSGNLTAAVAAAIAGGWLPDGAPSPPSS